MLDCLLLCVVAGAVLASFHSIPFRLPFQMTGLFVAQHAVALEAPALAYMNSTAASAVSPLPPPVKKSANGDEAFPMKLYRMLEDVERNGQQDIIGWNATGDKFIVYQPKVFASTWMLRYFNQSKYKSFQRQLNLYNFRRESQGRIKGICKCFQCGMYCRFIPLFSHHSFLPFLLFAFSSRLPRNVSSRKGECGPQIASSGCPWNLPRGQQQQ